MTENALQELFTSLRQQWLRAYEADEIVRHHRQLEADKRRSVTTDLGQGWARKAVYTITLRS